jgi:tight adherence protein B
MDLDFLILNVLGKWGVLFGIGVVVFVYSFKNSESLFQWIEDQTFGNRDFILQKGDLLFIKFNPQRVTYLLLATSIGSGIFSFALLMILGHSYWGVILGVICFVLGWKLPRPIMNFLVERRIKKYSLQMVDALNLLSNGIRAGLSMNQAIGMVVDELPNPIAQEFNLILQQNRIGVPLDECMLNLNKRIPTEDNEMFVTSVSILRETGGNLAETFDNTADVIRERVRLQQKLETYVAQAKSQGIVIFSMPFALLAFFVLTDPEARASLFSSAIGMVLVVFAFGLNFLGGFIMLKIIRIKA